VGLRGVTDDWLAAADGDDATVYEAECRVPVERAAMVQWWEEVTFIHWRFDPAVVQRLLPPGLTVETFDGSAWVGLVPFFLRLRVVKDRSVPWLTTFAETNVRTYVRSADGTSGVWFFSLDAARLSAVVVARCTYRLPYFWARMRIDRSGSTIAYRSRRRWSRSKAASATTVKVGRPFEPAELGQLDHFLTARYALFSAPRGGLRHARAFHEVWPLHRAELVDLDDSLVVAAGLPTPPAPPLVHYAPAVRVRIGWPTRVAHR
jgi:uncharacterized protein